MNNCCEKNKFPDHSRELARLNRVCGQVEGVKKMIEDNRYCPDIIIQLKAISSAIKSIEGVILKSHLESCVREVFQEGNKVGQKEKIDELLSLYKKL